MIHATELMIGDWVFDERFNKYHKVDLENDFHFICSGETCFKPILLTPEILEKNGFSLERDGAYTYYDDVHIPEQQYIAVLFRHNLTVRHIEIKRMRCHTNYDELIYVHQFQQALRLCGLNELADNFKVE